MPCGKRPLVKMWDKPKRLRVITPSRYEQTLDSVKAHWNDVIKDLEDSYKDEQFWESNSATVRELVGPVIFERIVKIFDLPKEEAEYVPQDELEVIPSTQFYTSRVGVRESTFKPDMRKDYQPETSIDEEEAVAEESEWTEHSVDASELQKKPRSSRVIVSKSISKLLSKSFSRYISMLMSKKELAESDKANGEKSSNTPPESLADSGDDLHVRPGTTDRAYATKRVQSNPFFDMLYCNESETDMIKWKSKYKQKTIEVSASDEFSKRAEILTKKIATDFYDWWVGLGNVEFKSEIRRPEDIEALFQVWFDEHASRGIVIDPQIIPCVLRSIANSIGIRKASCLRALKRQIASDIHAETSPAHTMAFGTCLPHKLKHIPPKNNTSQQWHRVIIPEDLSSMSCVWGDIQHLTSTKAFQEWLVKHPHLAMPRFLKHLHAPGTDKKSLFVVPSDYVLKEPGAESTSAPELALPVSQFSVELKEVLSRLMNQ